VQHIRRVNSGKPPDRSMLAALPEGIPEHRSRSRGLSETRRSQEGARETNWRLRRTDRQLGFLAHRELGNAWYNAVSLCGSGPSCKHRTFVPASDHLSDANLSLERLAAVARRVKLAPACPVSLWHIPSRERRKNGPACESADIVDLDWGGLGQTRSLSRCHVKETVNQPTSPFLGKV
jgi:hypothetical protein